MRDGLILVLSPVVLTLLTFYCYQVMRDNYSTTGDVKEFLGLIGTCLFGVLSFMAVIANIIIFCSYSI